MTAPQRPPTPRPLGVTLVGWLFIAAGVVGTVHHAPDLVGPPPLQPDAVWVVALRLLALAGGVFLLRGANWARWVVLAWLAYHMALGAFHSISEVLAHAALLLGVGWVLLRAPGARYFGKYPTDAPAADRGDRHERA